MYDSLYHRIFKTGFNAEAPFSDLHLSVANGFVSSKTYAVNRDSELLQWHRFKVYRNIRMTRNKWKKILATNIER